MGREERGCDGIGMGWGGMECDGVVSSEKGLWFCGHLSFVLREGPHLHLVLLIGRVESR